jgi:hypothetical protein
MKNSMSKFRIALAACFIVLSYSLSKAETQDSKTRPSFDEKMKIDLFYPVATSYHTRPRRLHTENSFLI